MQEARKFIITGQGRSGSNLLKFALKAHSDLEVIGEYFNTRVYPEAVEQRGNQRAREYFASAKESTRAIGFKIFHHQATTTPSKSVWRYLTNKNVFVVHLIRRNSFERLMSLAVATQSRAWVGKEENQNLHDSIRLNKDPKLWFEEIERDIAVENKLQQAFNNNKYLQIFYEDIVDDPQAIFRKIQIFLGVDPTNLPMKLKKQERIPKRVRCENYQDIVDHFKGTKHEWMFGED